MYKVEVSLYLGLSPCFRVYWRSRSRFWGHRPEGWTDRHRLLQRDVGLRQLVRVGSTHSFCFLWGGGQSGNASGWVGAQWGMGKQMEISRCDYEYRLIQNWFMHITHVTFCQQLTVSKACGIYFLFSLTFWPFFASLISHCFCFVFRNQLNLVTEELVDPER